MGDYWKKVLPGHPLRIPASAYNAFVDAALDHRQRTHGLDADWRQRDTDRDVVIVRNDTGSLLAQYSIVGIDDIIIDPYGGSGSEPEFRQRIVLAGVVPALPRHRGRFAITLETIAPNAFGRAAVGGVCQVRVYSTWMWDDPAHSYADIANGATSYLMQAANGSALVLWRSTGAGALWAVVRLGVTPSLYWVDLEVDGGGDGGQTYPATWTYQVKDPLSWNVLAEHVNPTQEPSRVRRPNGWCVPATTGLLVYDRFGSMGLLWVNELYQGWWPCP